MDPNNISPDGVYRAGARVNPPGLALPEFTDLAHGVDALARRIPWWVWLAGGVMLAKYLDGRGRRGGGLSIG